MSDKHTCSIAGSTLPEIILSDKFLFTTSGTRVILTLGRVEELAMYVRQQKPRGNGPGFFVTWLIVLIVLSVQPFAYVVGGYTRHDRNYKVEELLHVKHPLPAGVTRQSYYITRF